MMEGAELERLVRDAEILRLRTEEKLTYRQISERLNGEISYVMVGKILNRLIEATEESIKERREHVAEMQERALAMAYEKYEQTRLASDLQAFVKVAESFKATFGINGPTTHQHNVAVSPKTQQILDAVLIDAPQPLIEAWENSSYDR